MTPDWTPPSVLTLLELNFHLAVLLWLPCSELTNGFESQPESSHHASPKHTRPKLVSPDTFYPWPSNPPALAALGSCGCSHQESSSLPETFMFLCRMGFPRSLWGSPPHFFYAFAEKPTSKWDLPWLPYLQEPPHSRSDVYIFIIFFITCILLSLCTEIWSMISITEAFFVSPTPVVRLGETWV